MKNVFLHVVALAVFLLFIPIVNFAQTPDLGTAANFILFTTTGEVKEMTAPSILTGNVGTNSGPINGFGNVNGNVYIPGGATALASADLLTAYNKLHAMPGTGSHAPGLGGGETITPGVYDIGGVSTLDGILNLDGGANDIFIFRLSAAFSTTANAQIVLLNSVQACNVFWVAEGAVNMATGTKMKGNVIVNVGAIVIDPGVSLEGRALTNAGAITINGISGNTPIGCERALLTGPGAPALASTTCYALYTAAGEATNTGVTKVTGDVGSNTVSPTGYMQEDVTGMIHSVPDSSTKQAALDAAGLYKQLHDLPYDIQLLHPDQFGNNLVLTPHTYFMEGAAALTGKVTLNADGNPDAIFVIRINGAFSTAVDAEVLLINGAQAKNVFWNVYGAVALAKNTKFKGTIVNDGGAIDLASGVQLEGRALANNGALSTAAITATMPPGCDNLLAVEWLYFRGKPVQDNVLLQWGTTNEMNNGFFTIEKSSDGRNFEMLTTVNATRETGKSEYLYSFTDKQPYSLNYYRINQTDNDGQKKYFNTIKVKVKINQGLKARHYVQASNIFIQTSGAVPAIGSVNLYSIDGKKISSQTIMLTKEESMHKIDKPSHKGMYILSIESHGEKLYTGKIMVN